MITSEFNASTQDPKENVLEKHVVEHFRACGLLHFEDADEYEAWLRSRLGLRFEQLQKLRNRFPLEGPCDPDTLRRFNDFVADARVFGPVSSGQADDIAQATVAITRELSNRERVLDLGCGVGYMATWFARAGGPGRLVVGIDFSASSVIRARTQAAALGVENVQFALGDITKALPEGPFDAIVDSATLYLLPDPQRALEHVATSLAPQGVLISVPQLGRARDIEAYVAEVEKAGMSVQQLSFVFANDQGRAVARPMITARFGASGDYDVQRAFAAATDTLRGPGVTSIWDRAL